MLSSIQIVPFSFMCVCVVVVCASGQCEIKFKKVEFNDSLVQGYFNETFVSSPEDCASLCLRTQGCSSVGLTTVFATEMTCYLYGTRVYSGLSATYRPGIVYFLPMKELSEVPPTYTCNSTYSFCYKVYNNNEIWSSAMTICEADGGNLFLADTREKNDLLLKEVQSGYMFIGATDKGQENVWNWLDGNSINRSYFAADRPDDHGGTQDCLAFSSNLKGLDDRSCEDANPFICEISLT